MTQLRFTHRAAGARLGLKGPGAAEWLGAQGVEVPSRPNSWSGSPHSAQGGLIVARLGAAEFFLEDAAEHGRLQPLNVAVAAAPPGVYPVLREDACFCLSGSATADVLAQVCNVNFAELDLDSQPVIMTLMIGVAVLVLPFAADGMARYLLWCDPTYGNYLGESVGRVVTECGGLDEHTHEGDLA